MKRVRLEWIENGKHYYRMIKPKVSVNDNLTFKAQGPFSKIRRMIVADDNRILAITIRGDEDFDPESGRPVRELKGTWVMVGRTIEFARGWVYFIGPSTVQCLWEQFGYDTPEELTHKMQTPDCEDFPNPRAEGCNCPWNMNLECYEGWYDDYWYESHDKNGNPI